jgi:plasmid stabilization system protein ParE
MSVPTRRFRVSDQAKEELYQIWKDVLELSGSYESADTLIEAIRGKFRLIMDFHLIGRVRPEIGTGIRSFVARSGTWCTTALQKSW